MTQQKFIWITNQSSPSGNITQGENGIVVVNIRPNISITHNYKKKDRMEITFKDDQKKYIIPSDIELENVYKMHMTHPNVEIVLRKYCEDHFEKV